MKTILFLSGIDFKEKSIQVIRKTPEEYFRAGWRVIYIVGRDNSKFGNYFYEKEIDPEGINVIRFYWPMTAFVDSVKLHVARIVLNKLRGWFVVFSLFWNAMKVCKSESIVIAYGYEIHGVLAVNLLRLFARKKKMRIVSRFQGTWLTYYFKQKRYMKLLLNIDSLIAICLPSDLCIMTDDGTQGDWLLKKIKVKSGVTRFWINGVDLVDKSLKNEKFLMDSSKRNLISVCRLEPWKRVDRSIKLISKLKNDFGFCNFKYYIIGDGIERNNLVEMVEAVGLSDYIVFVGAIPNKDVQRYLAGANYFLSSYDLSNVGNPLLEAVRSHKIIFTINNGDTAKWISHKHNGFIYDEKSYVEEGAKDLYRIINNQMEEAKIVEGVKELENKMLWTWEERFNAELRDVAMLLR